VCFEGVYAMHVYYNVTGGVTESVSFFSLQGISITCHLIYMTSWWPHEVRQCSYRFFLILIYYTLIIGNFIVIVLYMRTASLPFSVSKGCRSWRG
jgi:hypothetical protein